MVSFNMSHNKEFLDRFSKYSKIIGILFVLAGVAGIFYPIVLSLITAIFYGWLLLISSFMIAYHTFNTNKKDWLGWLKSVLLFIVGILISVNPIPGVAALGIIFATYFLMDAFASVALAFQIKPQNRWWLVLINGFLSLALGIYLLSGWPFNSLFLVGIFVGVSLFFDGIILLSMGKAAKETNQS